MEHDPASRLRLETFLPYRLSILSNTISSSIAEIYAEQFDLGIPEWRVMAVLGRHPNLSAIEVAERTLMDKVAVSRAVAKLLKSNRIQREFADADKRRSILSLSEIGSTVHARVAKLALDYEKELLAGMDGDDVETLNRICNQLLNRARAMNDERP